MQNIKKNFVKKQQKKKKTADFITNENKTRET